MELDTEPLVTRLSRRLAPYRFPALALLLAVVCGAVAMYKFASRAPHASTTSLPAQRCNPGSERCSAKLPDGGHIDFSISPSPIRPLVTLQLELALEGASAEQATVDFQGVDMDMGANRSTLTGRGTRFSGQAMLPICTTGRMNWEATLYLKTATRTLAVPFRFEVPAP